VSWSLLSKHQVCLHKHFDDHHQLDLDAIDLGIIDLIGPDAQIPVVLPAIKRRFALRLALVYSAVFALVGIHLPFFPVWLKAVGVDLWWIGLITAVPSLTRFTILPFATGLAERHNVLRQGIVVLAFLVALGFLTVGQFDRPLLILVAFIATACVWTPIMPMIDGYALKGVRLYVLDYGPLRLWGSAAFIVGAVVCGLLVDIVAARQLIWVIAATAVFGALASLGLQPLDIASPAVGGVTHAARGLLRQPAFLAIIFTSALVQGSHAAFYAFGTIVWQEAGLGGVTISCLWSLGVIAEIIVFAISPRFTWSPVTLVAFAAAIAALRWILMAQQPSVPVLAIVQTMHGLSFGLTQVGIVWLLSRTVPIALMATAQGYLVAASGLVTSCAIVMSGALYARYGEGVYYAMTAMALAGGCVVLLAKRELRTMASR
jgi:PPP family 3-phenylpropionic acid transporter